MVIAVGSFFSPDVTEDYSCYFIADSRAEG